MTRSLSFLMMSTSLLAACSGGVASLTAPGERAGSSPTESGSGFVLAVAEALSNDPLGVVDVTFVPAGETPRLRVLHDGAAYQPSRHRSGDVSFTQRCYAEDGLGIVEYREIALLQADGGSRLLTPCSDQIETPTGFTWIGAAQLSPSGRVAANLWQPEGPTIAVVYEAGREIARYPGFHNPAWVDDETLVLVGSTLAIVRIGEEPAALNADLAGVFGTLAVSPDSSQIAFERDFGLWAIGTDGSDLRPLLPPDLYMFPAWSPDGRWVASMQRQRPSSLDAIAVGNGTVEADFEYTNRKALTLVNVETGERRLADLSMHLGPSEMPQGYLSWY